MHMTFGQTRLRRARSARTWLRMGYPRIPAAARVVQPGPIARPGCRIAADDSQHLDPGHARMRSPSGVGYLVQSETARRATKAQIAWYSTLAGGTSQLLPTNKRDPIDVVALSLSGLIISL